LEHNLVRKRWYSEKRTPIFFVENCFRRKLTFVQKNFDENNRRRKKRTSSRLGKSRFCVHRVKNIYKSRISRESPGNGKSKLFMYKNRLHVATVMCATTSVSRQDCKWDEAEVFGKEFSIVSRKSALAM
jgi:hypothetical protein